jgi:Fe-S-cluster containining protein
MNFEKTEDLSTNFTKKINCLFIDPRIFTYRFICKCAGECCYYGVYTDYKEYKTILQIKEKLLPLFDETQSKNVNKWFEDPEVDKDFESGIAVGTEVINDKCTFLDKDGLCVLQKLAIMQGEYKWKYKPLYCILFPLTIFEGALTIDDEHIDRLPGCNSNSGNKMTLFEACTEELRYFFGEKGFDELKKYRDEYLLEFQEGVKADVAK